jgi:uncharacterized protein DUF3450
MNILKSFTLVSLLFAMNSHVEADELKVVVDNSAVINESAIKSQQKVDRLADEIQSKLQQFKSVNKETDGLKIYNAQMNRQIENQLLEMTRLSESMDQVTVIERQITPLMLRMISGLEEFVKLDVPFLPEERQNRLTQLNEMMDRADVAVSEKFRRVLEAYQVEVDYGRTIESYAGNAEVNDQQQEVNYLRIGRVALVFQSRDKQNMGIWDDKVKEWKPLDSNYRSQISKGLRMAKKQLAPDMIIVPIAAAEAK